MSELIEMKNKIDTLFMRIASAIRKNPKNRIEILVNLVEVQEVISTEDALVLIECYTLLYMTEEIERKIGLGQKSENVIYHMGEKLIADLTIILSNFKG